MEQVQAVLVIKMKDPSGLRPGSYNMTTWAKQIGQTLIRHCQGNGPLFEGIDTVELSVMTKVVEVINP